MNKSVSTVIKALSFVLLFSFLLPALAACGGGKEAAGTTGAISGTSGSGPATTTAGATSAETAAPGTTPDTQTTTGGEEPVTEPDKFDPSDIDGLVANFDAAILELSDGDSVTSWENLASGGKYEAVSYKDPGAPTYAAASDISGKPGVVFRKDSGLKLSGSEGLRIEDITILAVIRLNSIDGNSDNNQIFSKLTTAGYDHTWYFNINGSGLFNFGWKDTNGAYHDCGDSNCRVSKDQNYILTGVKENTTGYLYINGNRAGSTQSGTNKVVSNSEAVYIGAGDKLGRALDGTICQILMYDRTLSATEMFAAQKYLSDKWGIEINMESFIPESTNLTIKVGDAEINNFSISQANYVCTLPFGSTSVPGVSASASLDGKDLTLEIKQASSLSDKASIYVKDFDALYTVSFRTLEKEFSGLTAPDESEVTVNDAFWNSRLGLYAGTTVKYALDQLEKQGALKNFENVINGKRQVINNPWEDGLLFETITGAADFLSVHPNDAIKKQIDGYIDIVLAASKKSKNGYLSTHAMIEKPGKYFDETGNARWYHDCYNFGCLAEAAVRYYKATGDLKLLFVAVRFANFIADNYGYGTKADGTPKINMVPSHSLPEETLLQLYILLRDEQGLVEKLEKFDSDYPLTIDPESYAGLVKFWIENRGNMKGRLGSYGAYAQDDAYYFDQTIAEGHAVRANLFYTGIAAAGIEFKNNSYLESARVLFDNIYHTQMYVNGSTGSTADDEAYGGNYVLPNDGYCETCASAALGFFTGYMTLAFEDSKYADTLENIMYNAVLGGIGLEGKTFYYVQPLNSGSNARWAWNDCPCCVPMFLKFMSRLSSYIYAYDSERIFINQFISSSAKLNGVDISMTCDMPYSGNCTINVSGGTTLCIRIPGWADSVTLKVNGSEASYKTENGYAVISVSAGDTVEYTMDMSARRIYADSRVTSDAGRVAIAYGPVIYCVEGVDNKDFPGVSSSENAVILPVSSEIKAEYKADLLGGIAELTFEALDSSGSARTAKAVPFYARLNRGTTSAYVWLKEKK